jgi:hypothetical protein
MGGKRRAARARALKPQQDCPSKALCNPPRSSLPLPPSQPSHLLLACTPLLTARSSAPSLHTPLPSPSQPPPPIPRPVPWLSHSLPLLRPPTPTGHPSPRRTARQMADRFAPLTPQWACNAICLPALLFRPPSLGDGDDLAHFVLQEVSVVRRLRTHDSYSGRMQYDILRWVTGGRGPWRHPSRGPQRAPWPYQAAMGARRGPTSF